LKGSGAFTKVGPSVQILLDTSFLLTMLKLHRDPVEEIKAELSGNVKILIPDIVVFELGRLARRASAETHAFASASLSFLDRRKLAVIEHKPGPTDVDAALIAWALTEKTLTGVATVDTALRSALASQDVPVIYPKARRGLVAERFHF
jgi:rRNA-processing protein FCF1